MSLSMSVVSSRLDLFGGSEDCSSGAPLSVLITGFAVASAAEQAENLISE